LKEICAAESARRGKIRVVLINTPLDFYEVGSCPRYDTLFPFGLALLAEIAKGQGISCVLIDGEALRLSVTEISEFVLALRPDLVGINLLSPTIPVAAKICKQIEGAARFVVGGGPHVTFEPGDTIRRIPQLTHLFRGEAIDAWTKFLPSVFMNPSPYPIRGVSLPGQPLGTLGERTMDLDSLPEIQRRDLAFPFYQQVSGRRETSILASLGCAEQCRYCAGRSFWGGILRFRTPERVVDEIERCVQTEGIDAFHFADDNLLQDARYLRSFRRELERRNIRVVWRAFARVDHVSGGVLEDAVASGCYRLTFGIESGSDRVLQKMNKGHGTEDALKAIHACKRAGIETKAFFMLGYPGETRDDMESTVSFAMDSGLDWAYFYLVRAFPGTALFADLLRRGYAREELLEYVHWVPAMDTGLSEVERACRSLLQSSGGFSVDSVLKYNVAHRRSISEYSTNEELVEVLASAYRRFYYRPAFVETLKARLKPVELG
jgi:radical SAM superfamily enzyme YgiQ (UPF0313 family)